MVGASTENVNAELNINQEGSRETAVNSSGGKYLTFFLGGEEYGIEILKVYEIIGLMPITPVPRTPKSIKGVINLRGKVIPVMDMRTRFGMEEIVKTDQTCIIVVQAHENQMGIIADRVSEVVDIADDEIDNTPSFGIDVTTDYILGIGKCGENVKLLLDIDKVVSTRDFAEFRSAEVLSNDRETDPQEGEAILAE